MKRVFAVASVAGLFLTGVVVGLLAAHLFYSERVERIGGPHGLAARAYHERVSRQLALSEEQRERVDEILRRSHQRAAEIRRQMAPEVEAILDRAADDIAEILDQEQRREFEELRRDRRRWSELFLLGPPRGPGHGPHPRGLWERLHGRPRHRPPGGEPAPPLPEAPPGDERPPGE